MLLSQNGQMHPLPPVAVWTRIQQPICPAKVVVRFTDQQRAMYWKEKLSMSKRVAIIQSRRHRGGESRQRIR